MQAELVINSIGDAQLVTIFGQRLEAVEIEVALLHLWGHFFLETFLEGVEVYTILQAEYHQCGKMCIVADSHSVIDVHAQRIGKFEVLCLEVLEHSVDGDTL